MCSLCSHGAVVAVVVGFAFQFDSLTITNTEFMLSVSGSWEVSPGAEWEHCCTADA